MLILAIFIQSLYISVCSFFRSRLIFGFVHGWAVPLRGLVSKKFVGI